MDALMAELDQSSREWDERPASTKPLIVADYWPDAQPATA